MADLPWECPLCRCLFVRPGFGHEACAPVPAGADVWHCVEHGCELTDAEGGLWCPVGEHGVPDAVLAVWAGMHDVPDAEPVP